MTDNLYARIRVVVTRDSDQRILKAMAETFSRMSEKDKANAPVVENRE